MKAVMLTDQQHAAVLKALGWVESAGDYSELAETMTSGEKGALRRAHAVLRNAPNKFKRIRAPRGLAR